MRTATAGRDGQTLLGKGSAASLLARARTGTVLYFASQSVPAALTGMHAHPQGPEGPRIRWSHAPPRQRACLQDLRSTALPDSRFTLQHRLRISLLVQCRPVYSPTCTRARLALGAVPADPCPAGGFYQASRSITRYRKRERGVECTPNAGAQALARAWAMPSLRWWRRI